MLTYTFNSETIFTHISFLCNNCEINYNWRYNFCLNLLIIKLCYCSFDNKNIKILVYDHLRIYFGFQIYIVLIRLKIIIEKF